MNVIKALHGEVAWDIFYNNDEEDSSGHRQGSWPERRRAANDDDFHKRLHSARSHSARRVGCHDWFCRTKALRGLRGVARKTDGTRQPLPSLRVPRVVRGASRPATIQPKDAGRPRQHWSARSRRKARTHKVTHRVPEIKRAQYALALDYVWPTATVWVLDKQLSRCYNPG